MRNPDLVRIEEEGHQHTAGKRQPFRQTGPWQSEPLDDHVVELEVTCFIDSVARPHLSDQARTA